MTKARFCDRWQPEGNREQRDNEKTAPWRGSLGSPNGIRVRSRGAANARQVRRGMTLECLAARRKSSTNAIEPEGQCERYVWLLPWSR